MAAPESVNEILKTANISKATLVFCLGGERADLLKEVESRRKHSDIPIIVIEKTYTPTLEKLRSPFVDVVSDNLSKLLEKLHQTMTEKALWDSSIEVVGDPAVLKRDPLFWFRVAKSIPELKSRVRAGFGNSLSDQMNGLRNCVDNMDLSMVNAGLHVWRGSARGKTAVSIASGWSLTRETVKKLREVSDHAIIIATDSSMKFLLGHDLEPHFVTSLERESAVGDCFRGAKIPERTNLFAPVVSERKSLEAFEGKRILFSTHGGYQEILGHRRLGLLSAGHSAGNINLALATALGCGRVIMVGHDLALHPDRFTTHFEEIGDERGAVKAKADWDTRESLAEVGSQDGTSQVWTTNFYWMIRGEIEQWISMHPEVEFVNMSAKGARIEGAHSGEWIEVLNSLKNTPLVLFQKNAAKPFVPRECLQRTEASLAALTECLQEVHQLLDRAGGDFLTSALELREKWIRRPSISFQLGVLSVLTPAVTMYERALVEEEVVPSGDPNRKTLILREHFTLWKAYLPQIMHELNRAAATLKTLA